MDFTTQESTRSETQEPSAKLMAVIDIGATSIRMAVAEVQPDGNIHTLDRLAQAVNLGRDTFSRGTIAPETTEACVRALSSYRQVLNEYGISDPRQIHVVATSAVREAANRQSFLKRIYVGTGFHVEPFDEAAVTRVTYLGIQPLLESAPRLAEGETVVVEVGGGSTEVLLIQAGNVTFARTYRLGALRLRAQLEAYRTPSQKVRGIMESQIRRIADEVRARFHSNDRLNMITLGGDIRFAAAQLLPKNASRALPELPLASLQRLTDKIMEMSVDEVLHKYHLAFTDAEAAGPALLTYTQLAEALGLDKVLVSTINLRDGLLKDMANNQAWALLFSKQIIQSAIGLGRRFGFDEAHGRHVARLSRTLFRALQSQHGLDSRHEMLLYIAALLHDVGYAVSVRSHHKHSMYLISHGELFGLSKRDVLLTALTARYHRRASPRPTHEGYASLDWENRVNVAKMAALLRVADALDRSNTQRIQDIVCSREDDRLVITVPSVDDISLEQLAMRQKGILFKELFGLTVVLRNEADLTAES